MTTRHETTASQPPERDPDSAAEILLRVRRVAILALAPIALAPALDLLVDPGRLSARLASCSVEVALCLAAFAAAHLPAARRLAVPIAIAFAIGMSASLLRALARSPHDLGLVAIVPAAMVATALLFPWGAFPQAIVSAFLALGYLTLVGQPADPTALAKVFVPAAFGVVLSVVGAAELERHRRASRERSRLEHEAAEVTGVLLHVGQTLAGRLGRADVLDEVARLTMEALACEWCSIYVLDERRGAFRLRANAGARPELRAEVEQIEFMPNAFPIVSAARPGEVLELPDCTQQTLIPPALMARWEISSLLGVAVFREDQVVGSMIAGYRQRTGPFSERQRRVALGIAHETAIALENTRLIADLEAASRLKSEFVSTMSHELRSPLNAILGFAEMARDTEMPAAERDGCLMRLESAGRELLRLIESTLEVGKLEAGRDDVRFDAIALRAFWDELARGCATLPHAPEVVLQWSPDVPDVAVASDPRKLTLIVRNLVGNALKFTERGWVRVDARLVADALLVRVADSGIGIRPEDRETIFELFRQADGSDSRRYGGTGLGLYIVKRFVEQLGGTIELDSTVGTGSTFVVSVPVARAVSPRRTGAATRPVRAAAGRAG
jgi:signal transduction histidine kinase